MTAELFEGNVLQLTLHGRSENLEILEHLLAEAGDVSGYTIDETNTLTAFVRPGRGEMAVVRALIASGMYPLETLDPEHTMFGGGPRAC